MTIDRSFLESELASVRAQQQQAAAIIQQMLGAEKTLTDLLAHLDAEEANFQRQAATAQPLNSKGRKPAHSEGAVQ